MELKDFIENFAKQFFYTSANDIKADTNYKELEEWSSVTALSIMAMIDEKCNVLVERDDIRSANTVEELFRKVEALSV
jgi:acyl carrier protein